MTGNCLGWLAYAYYSGDPFVLASNVPGILVSFWLNAGASKLQYFESSSNNNNTTAFTRQDKLMLGVLAFWIAALVGVGWLGLADGYEKEIVGILVNINLLFFYAAPLQTIQTVIREKTSDSIHAPTMVLNCTNAGFWGAYGIATRNVVIYGPNGIGLLLGLIQAALCCVYPKTTISWNQIISPQDIDDTPLLSDAQHIAETETDDSNVEVPTSQLV